ncbi:tRNA (guanosine(37)-N1)-methyltransferase TrmD [candidate division KSB3 bacterium]|uniref:tRNA (guanine-N(1)-)-methyltransferase n=1 Tax=candidate division KSB3 bacterium TaxID=2044937 RepID=A0A2G6E3F3_9BACT|nr:MAG: tRNA (guanosine(37)-N1)-methyltransferase TrmD [candidate division KSB3 bacterium]PIE29182.1 MAG: tRNA (guanosine(37)-N1)-methyltransferase TrmD [candidate division KSB3 bacterium]
MKIFVLTLFPEMFDGVLTQSMMKRARARGCLELHLYNIRDFSDGKHKMADDRPYGGGGGMVMKPEPIFKAVEHVIDAHCLRRHKLIYLTPQGTTLTQGLVKTLGLEDELILLCGHYEEIDERVRIALVDLEISIGDYVLTGGELAAMVLVDAIARMIPDVVGKAKSVVNDSFYGRLLDYPHYTRPAEYRGLKVPDVLLSGNHKRIDDWRHEQALQRTKERRPDLLVDD